MKNPLEHAPTPILVGILLVILFTLVQVLTLFSPAQDTDQFSYQSIHSNAYKTYTNDGAGFTLYYPDLWLPNQTPLDSKLITKAQLSTKHKNTPCTFAYGTIDEGNLLAMKNASTSRTIFNNQGANYLPPKPKNVSVIEIPFDREPTAEEKISGRTGLKLVAVPHFPYTSSPSGFLLATENDQPLLEACIDVFRRALTDASIAVPSEKISSQSTGTFSIFNTHNKFEKSEVDSLPYRLLFENNTAGRDELIAPEVFANSKNISEPFLSGNKLFYMEGSDRNPVVRVFDIFTSQLNTLPLSNESGESIHSFFVKKDIVYYLTGIYCKDYLAKCSDIKLKKYDLKTGADEVLARGITSRSITGFSADGDTLFLVSANGDGEHAWGTYSSFTFSTKSLKVVGSYSQSGNEVSSEFKRLTNLATGTKRFEFLVIKNGNIFYPRNYKNTYSDKLDIRLNTSEYPIEQ